MTDRPFCRFCGADLPKPHMSEGGAEADPFFCSASHAQDFGRLMARSGHMTKQCQQAIEASWQPNKRRTG